MKILYVTQHLPVAPLTGAHTRTLSMLAALARHHEVAIVGRLPAGAEPMGVGDLCVDVRVVRYRGVDHRTPLRCLLSASRRCFTPVPLLAQSRDAELAAAVEEAIVAHRPRVVHLFNMYAAHYRRSDRPTVLDLPDIVSGLCESAARARPMKYGAARIQQRRVELAERVLLRLVHPVTINDADTARLRRLGIDAFMIPLAFALPEWSTTDSGSNPRPVAGRPLNLLFVGSYLHRPNLEAGCFLEQRLVPALDACLRRSPVSWARCCRITIAGKAVRPLTRGPRRVARLSGGRAGDCSEWSSECLAAAKYGGVEIVWRTDVPDLSSTYRQADIVIVPLAHGGGTKNKTLEAMAWGRPVVGTPEAFSGLGHKAARACTVVPLDGVAMAQAILSLAGDPQAMARMGAAGRSYVAREHSQELVNRRVDALYDAIAAGGGTADALRILDKG